VRKIGPDGYVTTFAGNPVPGFSDGPAFQAQFQVNAEGIAADGQGNIYVGDTFNERIRKINTAAQVNTLAGDGMEGFRDGDAGSAEFRFPGAIVFDKQGNLYVWDYGNYCIRKITPAGVVSKFSGSGENGYEDGNASQAKFHVVFDMVADSEGNLYVADDNRIRKVTPTGSVSTIAGGSTAGYRDGEGTIARFALPSGLAIDEEGNIYVADANNNRIRKISFQ
jgi:sugar lactone lactonase YvrE